MKFPSTKLRHAATLFFAATSVVQGKTIRTLTPDEFKAFAQKSGNLAELHTIFTNFVNNPSLTHPVQTLTDLIQTANDALKKGRTLIHDVPNIDDLTARRPTVPQNLWTALAELKDRLESSDATNASSREPLALWVFQGYLEAAAGKYILNETACHALRFTAENLSEFIDDSVQNANVAYRALTAALSQTSSAEAWGDVVRPAIVAISEFLETYQAMTIGMSSILAPHALCGELDPTQDLSPDAEFETEFIMPFIFDHEILWDLPLSISDKGKPDNGDLTRRGESPGDNNRRVVDWLTSFLKFPIDLIKAIIKHMRISKTSGRKESNASSVPQRGRKGSGSIPPEERKGSSSSDIPQRGRKVVTSPEERERIHKGFQDWIDAGGLNRRPWSPTRKHPRQWGN
ncbi:hypothetical protein TWF696_008872 [Orbilia brochopaga]|uniref:Uncharacterized protein n=1 Tax=Orbilia brochopaga TaxID=3140254 RepID=A0AAV9UHW3_9PEZI